MKSNDGMLFAELNNNKPINKQLIVDYEKKKVKEIALRSILSINVRSYL